MLRILSVIFCCLSFMSFANEYKVSLLGLGSSPDIQCSVAAINDKGQILGSYNETLNYNKSKIYLLDSKNGLTLIEAKDQAVYPITMNNVGQVLGHGNKPFIWSKALGLRWLDIFNSTYVKATDLNDLGQIIGSYQLVGSNEAMRPFMWDYGVVTDMGPGSDFSKSIESLGFHIMEIQLMSINNKGELAGYFAYGKYNEKKKKYVRVGYECFYWDGEAHIIPLPVFLVQEPNLMKVNNHGAVLICDFYGNYFWRLEQGLETINNFSGSAINDSNTVLGWSSGPAIWKDGVIISIGDLLGVADIEHLAPLYSDDYAIEKLTNFMDINNKGQILCLGYIWGDTYPCLLEPIKKHDSFKPDLNAFMDTYNSCKDPDKGSALSYAIKQKYQDIVAHLISQTSKSDNDFLNCLFVAAESGNTEAISLMADAGWDIHARKKPFNETLLHQAARYGHPDTCQELINLGLNFNDGEMHTKQSPLYLTTVLSINAKNDLEKKNALRAARVLINNGADPNIRIECGETPLINLCRGSHDYDFVEFLLASGADPNLTYADGVSPLNMTIRQTNRGNMTERQKILRLLLENGANPNQLGATCDHKDLMPYKYKLPPIVVAICLNDSNLVEMLIEYGADIVKPVRSNQYVTMYPLDYAINWNKKEIIEILTRHGAKKSSK